MSQLNRAQDIGFQAMFRNGMYSSVQNAFRNAQEQGIRNIYFGRLSFGQLIQQYAMGSFVAFRQYIALLRGANPMQDGGIPLQRALAQGPAAAPAAAAPAAAPAAAAPVAQKAALAAVQGPILQQERDRGGR